MSKPKIYFVKPRCGWTFVDAYMKNRLVDPFLKLCTKKGYTIDEKSGCTTAEFNDILKKPDAFGVILAGGHGDTFGAQFDPPDKKAKCTEQTTKTLKSYYDPDHPDQSITDSPNTNLKFVVIHACNVSKGTLDEYEKRLRKTAKQVDVYGWPGKDRLSLRGLPMTVKKVCSNLPNAPATIPSSKTQTIRGSFPYPNIPRLKINAPQHMNHTVRFDDRIWYLADDYGYTDRSQFVEDVRKLNPGIDFTNLMPGEVIKVPTKIKSPTLSPPYMQQKNRQTIIPSSLKERIKILGEADEGSEIGLHPPQSHPQVGSWQHLAQSLVEQDKPEPQVNIRPQQHPFQQERIKILSEADEGSQVSLNPPQSHPQVGSWQHLAQSLVEQDEPEPQVNIRPQQHPFQPVSIPHIAKDLQDEPGPQVNIRPQQEISRPISFEHITEDLHEEHGPQFNIRDRQSFSQPAPFQANAQSLHASPFRLSHSPTEWQPQQSSFQSSSFGHMAQGLQESPLQHSSFQSGWRPQQSSFQPGSLGYMDRGLQGSPFQSSSFQTDLRPQQSSFSQQGMTRFRR